jgi:hypothetical protein
MKLSVAGVLLAVFVAACAAPPPPPPPPPPKPAFTPETIDGVYRGTSTRYRAESRACPSPGLVTLDVESGQFSYRWKYHVMVPATILPDGSVQGQLDDLTLTGRLVPAEPPASPGGRPTLQRIEGDVSNAQCAVHYTVTKRRSVPPA